MRELVNKESPTMIDTLPSPPAQSESGTAVPQAVPSSELAIQIQDVGKVYHIYDRPEDRLKQMFLWRFGRHYGRDFWALRHISFEVPKGETFGIIGRNGSGKSTLLQIIAGTLHPTEGQVSVNGRIAALLELGSGFNPEFTGRDNVYMNGAILGLSRAEMDARIGEIIAFADIGEFIDQPTKTYSSGMVVRLAFAVQATVDPDILIVDEALAVGDMYFQSKCMARISQLQRSGTTILFVSHSLQTVKSLCQQAVLLDHGLMKAIGPVDAVADIYSSMQLYQPSSQQRSVDMHPTESDSYRSVMQPPFQERITERTGRGDARYCECCIFQQNREVDTVLHGEMCEIVAWLEHHTDLIDTAEVGVLIRNRDGVDLFAINSYFLNRPYPPQRAGNMVRIHFRFPVTMAPGIYNVVLGLRVPQQAEYWDKVYGAAIFQVVTRAETYIPGLFAVPGEIDFHSV